MNTLANYLGVVAKKDIKIISEHPEFFPFVRVGKKNTGYLVCGDDIFYQVVIDYLLPFIGISSSTHYFFYRGSCKCVLIPSVEGYNSADFKRLFSFYRFFGLDIRQSNIYFPTDGKSTLLGNMKLDMEIPTRVNVWKYVGGPFSFREEVKKILSISMNNYQEVRSMLTEKMKEVCNNPILREEYLFLVPRLEGLVP